jgi:exopolysaccharide biosynthesis polyprenyl glycosylphosphotransferase
VAAARYRWQRLAWKVGLFIADVLGAALAFHVAILFARGPLTVSQGWLANVWPAGLVLVFWLLFSLGHPGYLPRPHRPLITTANQCLLAVAGGAGTSIVLLYVIAPGSLVDRTVLLPASAVMFVVMVLTRHAAGALASREAFVERYLILGNGQRSRAILRELSNGRHPYQHVVGLVPFELGEPLPTDVPVLPIPQTTQALVDELEVTHAIVCHPQPLPREAARCVAECEAAGVEVHSMETAYETLTRRAPLFHVGDEWIASLDASAQTLYATRVKRVLDIILAALGLLLTGPLILLLAALVKLTSKGPAFYSQERVGRQGKHFTFTKLRTMVQDAEAKTGPVWAAEDDPRVTALGRFLRKTRLDELPQLWSVLRGDMSLVGPRPEREHFVMQFLGEIPLYGKRVLVLPGITGWAQVHHSYDACVEDVIEKLRYDLFYVNHVSFKLDLLILLKTIDVVIRGRGAR